MRGIRLALVRPAFWCLGIASLVWLGFETEREQERSASGRDAPAPSEPVVFPFRPAATGIGAAHAGFYKASRTTHV